MNAMIVLILVSLLLSAFFSGMEIAFVSANKLLFELDRQERGTRARMIALFYHHPQQYLSTMLVGNNVCLVVFSMQMARLLEPWLTAWTGGGVAVVSLLQSVIATLVVLFAGEFVPKNLFRNNPNRWMTAFSPLLMFFYVLLYPVAALCTWLSRVFLRPLGGEAGTEGQEPVFTRVDLNYLLESGQPDAAAEHAEPEMEILQNALDFSSVRLRDCCVPRTEIVALPINVDVETLKATFTESGFSKIVIYKDDIDNIVGCIHLSEMFEHQHQWQQHIISLPIVPENMAAQKLMKLFMQQKKSMAVVVDEFGGTAGIITLEDLMEEIFGDIRDEHDTEEFTAKRLNDHEIVLSGRMPVDECNERFGLHLPESEDYETIAGLLLHHCGRFPKTQEKVEIGDYTLQTLRQTANRIERVKLYC